MAFNYEYPYTDIQQNSDWILKKVKELNDRVENIKTEFLTESKAYTDAAIADNIGAIQAEVASFKIEVDNTLNAFANDIGEFKDVIGTEFDDFKTYVNAELILMNAKLEAFDRRLNIAVREANNYTSLAIQSNNEYIINEVKKGVAVEVINPASGERQTIQDAINYLFSLHTSNAITYDELVEKAITYDALAALNITYEQLAINGKILIP